MKKNVIREGATLVVSSVAFATDKTGTIVEKNGSPMVRISGYNDDDLETQTAVPMSALKGNFGQHLHKTNTDSQNLAIFGQLAEGRKLAFVRDIYEAGDRVTFVGDVSEDTLKKVKHIKENEYEVRSGKDEEGNPFTITKSRIQFMRDVKAEERMVIAKEKARLSFTAENNLSILLSTPVSVHAEEPKEETNPIDNKLKAGKKGAKANA